MKLIFGIFGVLLLSTTILGEDAKNQSQFDGCDLGWFRFKDYKCVYIFDFSVTYDEAEEYCKTAFGSDVLNITSEEERRFWSFHLMRYSNLSANVWLNKGLDKKVSGLQLHNECLSMRSKYTKDNGTIGSIAKHECHSLGTTVCEIKVNKKLASKAEAKEYNVNEDVVPNRRLNFSNGTQSDFFSGTYYVLISKFKNETFTNNVLGNGKCSIDGENEANCANTYTDGDLRDKTANYFMFTPESDNQVQIRRFDSDKIIVFEPEKYLGNFKCYEDGLTKIGKELCDDTLKDYNTISTWKIDPYKNTSYFVIRSSFKNLTLGAIEYNDGKNLSVGFGLYDAVDLKSKLDDKLLFKIEELNYTLDVQLYSIDFDQTLEQIMAVNKKQISIVDTTTINNNSPATLTHEVSSTKEITETFSTSYGVSQQFMDTFSARSELGSSLTDSSSKSKSFTDQASESISSSLTQSMSQSSSNSDESHSGSSTSVGANAGINAGIFSAGGSATHGWDSGSSRSHSSTSSNDHSHTDSNSKDKSHSNTDTKDKSHSNTTNVNNSKENSHQNQTTTDKRVDQGGSRMRSYSIYKTVSLPPYSAVKISSYANWIDDMTIKYNMSLKFSARSFRRLTNGEGTNSWRTMDKEFITFLLKKHKFPGDIIQGKGYDNVFGRVTGFMKASIGLDSVFIAKETTLSKHV